MDEKINLRLLRYFLAVAEELHFGRAAQRLHIAQPPLSQQLRLLEQALGFPLFERTSRRVALTPAGETMVSVARQCFADLKQGVAAARLEARGERVLRIGYVTTAILTFLPATVRAFRAQYPETRPPGSPGGSILARDLWNGRRRHGHHRRARRNGKLRPAAFCPLKADGTPESRKVCFGI